MIVIPAVDLREGRCVRLREGRADAETVFSDDPVAMAQRWIDAGAARLHVVDLDGAFAGAPRQTALIAKIVAAVRPVPVEAGGGLRDLAAVEAVLEAGAAWAVVGTRAVEPAFLAELCRRFGPRVIVAVDARDGRVAVKGWVDLSDMTPLELAHAVRDAGGVAALLYTDVSRDGTEQGPNVTATAALARESGIPSKSRSSPPCHTRFQPMWGTSSPTGKRRTTPGMASRPRPSPNSSLVENSSW